MAAEEEASSDSVKTSKAELLKSLTVDTSCLMLRKCIRKLHESDPEHSLCEALTQIMGEDPEPLPQTPPFVDTFARFRGRGRGRGRGMRGRGGRGRGRPNSRGNNSQNEMDDDLPALLEDARPPPARESMQEFFAEIEDLPDKERNQMIQTCMQELMSENKSLREANRKLAHKARLTDFPEEDVVPASIKSKPMNANAKEFEMRPKSEVSKEEGVSKGKIQELRYEDFVQMRRQEQSYEEMIAEQMYLEELEMRRFQHMYQDEYDSQYYQDYDYGSYYGGRSKRGYKVKN